MYMESVVHFMQISSRLDEAKIYNCFMEYWTIRAQTVQVLISFAAYSGS